MEQTALKYDFVVIGAGSGGMGAGRRAALFGKKVAMIENRVIGGTCVNVGCVPKKCMFNLASYLEEAHLFKDYGVNGTEALTLDFKHFKAQRDGYVKRLNGIYENNLKNSNIDYYTGTASFESKNQVRTSEGVLLEADHIMIASGSYPALDSFPGSELCWVSDDIFAMEELPKSMVVIGGGYIGVEIAGIMRALGTDVTLASRRLMLGFVDQEIVEILQENMTKAGLKFRNNSPHDKVEKLENGLLRVTFKDGSSIDAEKVLMAIGRNPNFEPLCLDKAGVEVSNNAIKVDEF